MSYPRTVSLRGKQIEITEAKRAARLAEMPEIGWIEDADLRDNVLDAWAAALEAHGFTQIGEMKPSGNYDSLPLLSGSQADHMRSVCRLAVKTAEEMAALFPAFRYNRDILIAGALCHDIGKVWEFQPDNVKRWKESPQAVGMPSIRHPAYGVYICLSMGLPEAIAHIAAAHSGEGELLERSLENTLVHWADVTFWKAVQAGGQLSSTDTWLDGLTAGVSGQPRA
ncbi:HD domain-containing protein [Chelatococcus sp. GCM10030263]|uniref:HD domain-containing protein n=1 Tax=Chelatococcus sp. GCM10030263 TaxID=3273387 RepID=UPI00360A9CB9